MRSARRTSGYYAQSARWLISEHFADETVRFPQQALKRFFTVWGMLKAYTAVPL